METGLQGKTALLTGGSSGIGKGIALALAAEGVRLAIASRRPDPAALDEIAAAGGAPVVRIAADVSQEGEVVRMVQAAIAGLGHLDFYINNAAWTWHQPITKLDSNAWYSTLNTNLSAAAWATREVSRHLIARRSGGIIIIGSTVRFFPAYTETAYRVSKMGLRMLMQQLAIELAPYGIRVNMVTPGHYATRMTGGIAPEVEDQLRGLIPLHRFGDPLEVGHAVAFLLSDKLSPYTVGGDLVIDGGLTLNPLPLRTADEIEQLNL
ncbi:MAG: SDR family oxidoreductase [Anaerolineales bacterium]|nr:SDR family oxidoreductase [Anaerolineales bacterium]